MNSLPQENPMTYKLYLSLFNHVHFVCEHALDLLVKIFSTLDLSNLNETNQQSVETNNWHLIKHCLRRLWSDITECYQPNSEMFPILLFIFKNPDSGNVFEATT
jgi:hypothetical protein